MLFTITIANKQLNRSKYRTCAIIYKGIFRKILALSTVSIQERVIMKYVRYMV